MNSEETSVDFKDLYRALEMRPNDYLPAREKAMNEAVQVMHTRIQQSLLSHNPSMSHANSRFTGSPAEAITKYVSPKAWVLYLTDGGHARQNPIPHWYGLGTVRRWTRGKKKQRKSAYRGEYPISGPVNFFDEGVNASYERAVSIIVNTLTEAIAKNISE